MFIRLRKKLGNIQRKILIRNRDKIFGIGLNKTGTTSLAKALKNLGFKLAPQKEGELFFIDWIQRDFSNIIEFSKQWEAFQDIPYGLPYTYIVLDQYFARGKFILTIRDSEDQWYNSLIKFHSKRFSTDNKLPTKSDLENSDYIYPGYPYMAIKNIFNTEDNDLYNKAILTSFYKRYNQSVLDYFKNKSHKLLVLNVAHKDAYDRLCLFLEKKSLENDFPWENKT